MRIIFYSIPNCSNGKELRQTFTALLGVCYLLCLVAVGEAECAEKNLSERKVQLIDELVSLTDEMDAFQTQVRDYYYEFMFISVDKMFVGTILENDPNALRIMRESIDDVIDWEFTEGTNLKRVHYLSFGAGMTVQELEELIEFYRTDVGRKVLSGNAGIFKEWKKNRNDWAKSLHSPIRRKTKLRLNEYYEKQLKQMGEHNKDAPGRGAE